MSTHPVFESNFGDAGLWHEHPAEATTQLSPGLKPGRLLGLIARWHKRTYLRRELMRLAQTSPHLINDIGLAMPEVEAEISKRFWQP